MITRAHCLALLLMGVSLRFTAAQELVVVVESPPYVLDTRLSNSPGTVALVVTAECSGFTLDTRLSIGLTLGGLVVSAESTGFTLDTRLSASPASSALIVAAESLAFTLDTRLATSNPTLVALVVTAESAAFVLDTRLVGRLEALIVQAVSPSFELNTMWIGIRRTARAFGSPVELYWPTNAPGFYPQSALPPLRPSMQWEDVNGTISESGGFYRTPLGPEGTDRYFRLKL